MKIERKWIATILVLILVLLVGSVGCRVPTPTTQPTSTAAPAPTPTPKVTPTLTPAPAPKPTPAVSKPAGTLVVAMSGLGDEVWLPDQAVFGQQPVSSCYEFLLYRDAEGKLVPGLAEKWEVSPDGLTLTFHLRKGIQFHDGWGEFTADDVKYSYELGSRKGSKSTAIVQWASVMDKVEVTDRYTIVFRLKKFTSLLLGRAGREYHPVFPIVSKKYVEAVGLEQAGRKPIGTGPYKFVEHTFGEYIKFEAVENHWRQTPAFKTLIIKKVPEEASRVAMLRAGEADVIEMSLDFKAEIEKAGFRIKSSSGASSYTITLGGQFFPDKPIFDPKYPWVGDPRDSKSWERAVKVRKALNLAVNRDEIVKQLLAGEGGPLAVTMAIPGSIMYDPALKPYPYDPEQARKLLVEAGYPTGFDMTMKVFDTPGRPESSAILQAVAMMWQKIGVRVKLEPAVYDAFRSLVMARKTAGLVWIYGAGFADDPVTTYMTMTYSKSGNPLHGVENVEVDKLIETADAEPNDQQRQKIERQLGQYVYDNYLMVPVAYKNSIYGVSNRVGDWGLQKEGMAYTVNFESIAYGPGFKP